MTGPRSTYLTLCDREIHVSQWGRPENPALVMWHGLARTGRDFDSLAAALQDAYFILAPDTLGRGLSQWATNPAEEYRIDVFAEMAMQMLQQFGISSCRWIGTSMGGAIGIYAAGGPMSHVISHLVINDIGPELPETAVERIVSYVGNPPRFASILELEVWLRTVYAPFGYLSDNEWRTMAETSARRTDKGDLTVHYDPRIVAQFEAGDELGDQWTSYDAIIAETLLLRGANSDLLTNELAEQMTRRGPRARRVDIPDVGHAPCLNVPEQIGLVREFLR